MTLQETLDNPSIQIAFIVEIEYRNPTTDVVSTVRYQTPNRNVDDGYASLLINPGDTTYNVEFDNLNSANSSNIVVSESRPCTLNNTPHTLGEDGPLSYLRSMSLSGRNITVYAGGVDDIFASYEELSKATMHGEPLFDGVNNTVEIRRESPIERFRGDLNIPSYVGEPGALYFITSSAAADCANNTAHHLTEFTLAGRFRHPGVVGVVRGISRRWNSPSIFKNWEILLRSDTGALQIRYSVAGVANAFSMISPLPYDDDLDHTWVCARRSGHAYMMVDNEIVASSLSPGIPDLPNPAPVRQGVNFDGGRILDHRIYNKYIPPDEMRSAMLTRAAGNEEGLVGLWRGDDYTGSTLTDYSSTGADATISGTEGIDFDWVTSGLGGEQLVGQSMPCVIGSVYHWAADLVDSILEVWRVLCNQSNHIGISDRDIYDQGEELSIGVDYDWDTIVADLDPLVYLLAGEAGEPVTAKLFTSSNSLPEEVLGPSSFSPNKLTLLLDYGPFTAAEINTTPMSSLFPNDIGIFTRKQPLSNVLSSVVRGMGSYVSIDGDNTLRVDTIVPPVSPSPRGSDSPCLEIVSTEKDKARIKWASTSAIIPTRDFTLAMWVKTLRTSPSNLSFDGINLMDMRVEGAHNSPPLYWYISVFTGTPTMTLDDGTFSHRAKTGFGQILSDPWAWWFVAVSHDHTNNVTKFYAAKEGETLALIGQDVDITLSSAPGSNGLAVGGGILDDYFRGSVLEPQIWNGVRTLAQLQSSMTTTLSGGEANLIFYAPCHTLNAADLTDTETSTLGVASGQVHERPDLTLDLNQTPYMMNRRNLIPAKSIEVRYRKNYAVLSPSDIAATVTQEDSLSRQKEYLSALWEDDTIGEDYKNARDIVVDSPFYDVNGANALLRLLQYRYRPGAEIAEVGNIQRVGLLLSSGDEVRVIGHESDIEEGLTYRVTGSHNNNIDLTTDLVLVR